MSIHYFLNLARYGRSNPGGSGAGRMMLPAAFRALAGLIFLGGIVAGCDRPPVEPVRVVAQHGTVDPRRAIYSPAKGNRLLVLEASGRLGVWNVTDPHHPELFASIPAGAIDAAFSPDGSVIVSGGGDGRVRWWTVDGRAAAVSGLAQDAPVRAVAVGTDFVVSGDELGTIRLWRPDGTPLGEPLTGNMGPIVSLAIAPNGDILSVSGDGSVRRWKSTGTAAAPRFEPTVLAQQRQPPDAEAFRQALHLDVTWGWDHSVVVAPDGAIGAALFDGALRFWNADGTVGATRADAHSKRPLRALAFSPQGDLLASAGFDGSVRFWNRDGTPNLTSIDGHINAVFSVSFNPAGNGVATVGADDRVRLWRLDGTQIAQLPAEQSAPPASIALSPQNAAVALADTGGVARICAIGAAACVGPLRTGAHALTSLAFASDGTAVAAGTSDGGFGEWMVDGRKRGELRGTSPNQSVVAFTQNPERLAVGGDTLRIVGPDGVVWHANGHPADLYKTLDMSSRGELIAAGTLLGRVGIWNADGTPHCDMTKLPKENIVALVFAPDGQSVLTAGGQETFVRSRRIDGTPGPPLEGHRGVVTALAASPERGLVASASSDGVVRIWQMPGTEVATVFVGLPVAQLGFVHDLMWARAGRSLFFYDREWRPVAAAELSSDGVLVYTPDGWFAGPAKAAETVLAFDATGRTLSARQAAKRASSERVRAAFSTLLEDGPPAN